MHFMVSAWGGRNWGFGSFDLTVTDHQDCVACERPRLTQQHKAQPGCSVLWRTYVRASGGRHADAWRTRWSAARRQRDLRQWPRHGRLSVAIDMAEALHHSAPLRAWPEMNAAQRGQTTDRRSREHWVLFDGRPGGSAGRPVPPHRCLRCGRRTRVWGTSWSRPCRRAPLSVCRSWSEELVEAPK